MAQRVVATMNQTRIATPDRKRDSALITRLSTAIVVTLVLVLLANQIRYIGGRVPYIFLILWLGSATVVALIFAPNNSESRKRSDESFSRQWAKKMHLAGMALLPLSLVPLWEIYSSGPDPMIWLMNTALLISICSTPYFALLSRKVVSAVVLTWGAATVLWIPCSTAMFQIIKRSEMAKDVSTVDTANTMHAFFDPEYRYLFYLLSAVVVLLYCPIMLLVSYRRFLRSGADA